MHTAPLILVARRNNKRRKTKTIAEGSVIA